MWTPTAAGDVRRSRVAREITMTDQALAQLLAELFTAIRLLSQLSKKRIIQIDRRDVVIADADKLTKVANYNEIAAYGFYISLPIGRWAQ